jgi:hypothetical protein
MKIVSNFQSILKSPKSKIKMYLFASNYVSFVPERELAIVDKGLGQDNPKRHEQHAPQHFSD